MIYGKRDNTGRIAASVEFLVWHTPEGRWVLRTETKDDEGCRHVGFLAGPDGAGWPLEADAEVALRQVVEGLLRNGAPAEVKP